MAFLNISASLKSFPTTEMKLRQTATFLLSTLVTYLELSVTSCGISTCLQAPSPLPAQTFDAFNNGQKSSRNFGLFLKLIRSDDCGFFFRDKSVITGLTDPGTQFTKWRYILLSPHVVNWTMLVQVHKNFSQMSLLKLVCWFYQIISVSVQTAHNSPIYDEFQTPVNIGLVLATRMG